MELVVKILGVLLLIAASASALCSKGCPDLPEVNNTVLKIPQLNYVYGLKQVYSTNGSNLLIPPRLVKVINCTTAYTTMNRRLGEYSVAQLVSWRLNSDQLYDSFAHYYTYNSENDWEMYDELQRFVTPFIWKIIYSDEKSNAQTWLFCIPENPSEVETCMYSWILVGTNPNFDSGTRDDILSKLADMGLDVKNGSLYSQDGCNY